MSRLHRFLGDERGLIALKFALALPGLALLAVGAIDLRAVASDRAAFQSVAEAAALTGARELALAVDKNGPTRRAESWALAQLTQMTQHPEAEVLASVETLPTGQRALKVAVDGRRPSFFGNLLPPGGWRIHADATAASVATLPLCILAHGDADMEVLKLKGKATVDAPACLVHANADIRVQGNARVTAAATQAVGQARGSIVSAPHSGAPPIDDPYADIDFRAPSGCPAEPKGTKIDANTTLQPGVHCGDVAVMEGAELRLAPGDHWFVNGMLYVDKTSRLTGSDVALMFDHAAFQFGGESRVSLKGREEGPFAGFVIVGLRPPGGTWCGKGGGKEDDDDGGGGLIGGLIGGVGGLVGGVVGGAGTALGLVDSDECAKARGSMFIMASDNVDVLEGVIYTPAAQFVVYGKTQVAEAADWTVMVVRRLQIVGSPTLVINANYGASPVPVPDGVGNKVGKMRLID